MKALRLMLPIALAFSVTTAGLYVQANAQDDAASTRPAYGHKKGEWQGKKGDHGDRQARREEMKKRFAEKLSLTSAQQAQIDAIHASYREAHKPEMEAMRAKFQELRTMKENGASEAELQAKKAALKAEMQSKRGGHEEVMNQVKAVLTPEQVQKLEAMKKEHMQKRGEHGKRGEGRRAPRAGADS